MRTIVIGCLSATAVLAIAMAACKREEPAQNPQGYQQVQPGAPPAQTGYYQQPQPTAPQAYPQATAAPQQYPQATPAAPQPAAAGTMNPSPTGLACTADGLIPCGAHHCNTALGKCSFPCLSAADCVAGTQCMGQICVPVLGTPAAK